VPSRFVDELPEESVEVTEAQAQFGGGFGGGFGGRPGGSRFDQIESFGSSYETPGWQRAQSRKAAGGFSDAGGGGWRGGGGRSGPTVIEGELVARSTGTESTFEPGARVLHMKFGPGTVAAVDGNKLTVEFDKAGRKMVLDSFVEKT